jgi:hypothetical protein
LRITAALIALLLATPALADIDIRVENRSSRAITAINTFPLDDDGEPVEDNLGGLGDDLAPGGTATINLNGECGPTRFFVRVSGQGDADDLELDADTCADRTIRLSD